jgi:murein L,D-transpeptidase YafK
MPHILRGRVLVAMVFASLITAFLCLPARPAPGTHGIPEKIDFILILKHDHLLELLANGKVIRTYKVALGSGGLARKERQGDGRTPEGRYVIDNRKAHSAYHKALHVSYPNAEDRKRAADLGVSPGGDIMIHGLPNGRGWIGPGHRAIDWTLGCIAVTDQEIDEIWNLVPVGTPVEIRP